FFIANLFLPHSSSVPLAALFIYFPFLYLKRKNNQYLALFSEYLADATSILAGSLKVGHSLEAAIESVANTAPHPLCTEFKTVSAEIRLGMPIEGAFRNLYHRIKTPELKILTTAIITHQELGGNLSELLENLEKTIRDRFALEREIKVLSSQGVFSMWVLCALPFVFAVVWYFIDRALLFEFAASSLGVTLLTASFMIQIVAFMWMRRIVLIKP
ncbi:MAG: type II secretion system F family protein, partial [Candidatus Omnitrophica bacterium]|nr:type II secretion system F family protein [Candidatus Omnitrophota bacterium]